jgi:hypothetical protein
MCLASEESAVHVLGLEEALDHCLHVVVVIRLATKNVQVHIVRLLAEMGADIGSLDELDQRVTGLVGRSKVLDAGRAIRNHVDLVHKRRRKEGDIILVSD